MASQRTTYEPVARQAAASVGIDAEIFVRQITQESGWDPVAGSSAGARGIAQIVPRFHPHVDPWDPVASLYYAARLMRSHLDRYGGDYALALAAYNAGSGAVDRYGGVPPYAETQAYVRSILGDSTPSSVSGPESPVATWPGDDSSPESVSTATFLLLATVIVTLVVLT